MIIVRAINAWVVSLADPDAAYVSEKVRRYAEGIVSNRRLKLQLTSARDIGRALLIEAHVRFSMKTAKQMPIRTRRTDAPISLTKSELEERVTQMATLMKALRLEQALAELGSAVVEWAATYNIADLRTNIKEFQELRDPQIKENSRRSYKNLTDQECSLFIFDMLTMSTDVF